MSIASDMQTPPNQPVEMHRRPAFPLGAGRQFGGTSCAQPSLSAAVAHLVRRAFPTFPILIFLGFAGCAKPTVAPKAHAPQSPSTPNAKPWDESDRRLVVYTNNDETISPLTYADKKSGLIYRVESDGRHVSASTGDGKQVWGRDPFVEARMEPYRQSKPVIRAIGTARDLGYTGDPDTIWIRFSSSQIGYIDPETGDFHYVLRD